MIESGVPVIGAPHFLGGISGELLLLGAPRCVQEKVRGVLLLGPPGGRRNRFCCPVRPTAHLRITLGR